MKYRNSHVTNSSSSSFILAFKDEDDFYEFKEHCDWLDYNEFYNLIKILMQDKDNLNKEEALDFLYRVYTWNLKCSILNEKFKDCVPCTEAWNQREEYTKSEEFKTLLDASLKDNEEYQEKKKQIEDAEIIVKGMIWDTSGGLLEWAIHNGFIEQNFAEWNVYVQNIG